MTFEQHRIDDVREVEALLLLEAFIVLAVGVGTIEAVTSGCEVVGDDALLDDVGDVVHIIDRDVALVLGVDPIELLQRMDGDGIVCGIFTREGAVGILDEDGTLDLLLEDGLIDGLRLRTGGFIEYDYLCIGDAIDAELKQETLCEGVLLIEVAQDGDVDVVELGEVEALEGPDAMHYAVFGYQEYFWNTRFVFWFIGCNRHDERACGVILTKTRKNPAAVAFAIAHGAMNVCLRL